MTKIIIIRIFVITMQTLVSVYQTVVTLTKCSVEFEIVLISRPGVDEKLPLLGM